MRLENLKAQVAVHHGQVARALAGFESALTACEPLGDARASIEMLTNLGSTLGDLGVLEEAEQRLSSALATAERLGLPLHRLVHPAEPGAGARPPGPLRRGARRR